MRPLPLAPPLRFGSAMLPPAMEVRLARRGGRAFAPRGHVGDVRITLPEVGGIATVLVPRGFGHPLPARRLGAELRADPGGEPCAPARWVPTGGVAAWLRAVPPPRGPTQALTAELPGGGAGPWLYVRVAELEWSALRLVTPAAGHGPVAVADRWIRAVSPEARARGVSRGMSVALATKRCPGLQVWPRPAGSLAAEVERRLGAWLGPVERRGGGFVARLGEEVVLGPPALGAAERLARLLWQELGVEARIALAATPEAARGLGGVLEPGWVGVASPLATAEWAGPAPRVARCNVGARAAGWQGAPLPDLEGAAVRARLLTPGLVAMARGKALRVRLTGFRGTRVVRVGVPDGCGRGGLARLVEAVVRREAAALGAIEAIGLRCVERRVGRGAAARSAVDARPEGREGARERAAGPRPGGKGRAPAATRVGAAVRAAAQRAAAQRAGREATERRRVAVEPVVPESPGQLALLPGLR